MKLPLDIRFIGLQPSDALDAAIREKVRHTELFCQDIIAWRITVEQEAKHKHQGRPFAVRIDVTLPGHELSVNRVQDEDAYVALRDAFDAVRRQIEERVQVRRGEVKRHEPPPAAAAAEPGEST